METPTPSTTTTNIDAWRQEAERVFLGDDRDTFQKRQSSWRPLADGPAFGYLILRTLERLEALLRAMSADSVARTRGGQGKVGSR